MLRCLFVFLFVYVTVIVSNENIVTYNIHPRESIVTGGVSSHTTLHTYITLITLPTRVLVPAPLHAARSSRFDGAGSTGAD